jgi:outer membrane protein OmpA-like peptidoglycan-associated protein
VKSPDYSTTNAVVLLGASPSYISQREGAVTVGTKEIKTVGGTSYTFWYADVSGWATMFFRFPTSAMSVNQWHWVVVNQDSTNGIQLFVDGVPGTPTGSVDNISAPAGDRFVSGTNTGGKQLYFFDDPARRASNGKMLVNGSYQIGAWFGKRYGDQKRDTIGGASFGDIRYTAPSIYSSASTSLAVPTSVPSALAGTQLLLTSGNSTNGMTDESGNQQLEFVNVTTSRANAAVKGWSTLLTQAPLNLTTTSANVNTATTLTTSGGSGSGGISFVVNSGPCTISSGNQLTASAAGTCVVAATKANDGTYNSTSVTGNIIVSATPPAVVVIPVPDPPQTSSIASVSTECLDGVNTIRMTGVFTARISNIALNSVNLESTQWNQTTSTVDVRPSTALSSQLLIQIYNGQIPLLAEQSTNFVNACLVAAPAPASSATPKPTPTPTPAPAPIVNVQPESTMKLVATFYFPLNSYLVNAANRTAIVGEAERIMSTSVKTVLIYGNTDSQGGVDNVWLSKQRATAVRKELRPLLSGKKIQLGWFADTRPAVKGKSQAAYAKNRRVEIWVK